MCGVAGLVRLGHTHKAGQDNSSTAYPASSDLAALAQAMGQTLKHRGPDDAGLWQDESLGVAFAHRRLAIVDLSPAGHQPMQSADGQWVLAFNGEIYNHLQLREALHSQGLAPLRWAGHSDTETLLACIQAWGLDAALKACVGMFALALWSRPAQTIYLARDRIGEKPLYLGWVHESTGLCQAFAFASELKAIQALPDFANPICSNALAKYLSLGYVPAPYAIFKGLYKLPPGHLLTLPLAALQLGPAPYDPLAASLLGDAAHQAQGMASRVELRRYWSFEPLWQALGKSQAQDDSGRSAQIARHKNAPDQDAPDQAAVTQAVTSLDALLRQSVAGQMLADVPLGAFLSGGVDSSTIVALMQAQSKQAVKTFTIGFDEPGFDESPHAQAVAKHLGTDHLCLRVQSAHAREVIPKLPTIYDEPFADSSQIPTHLVAQLAREHVTVALSGDAGDELFGGYNRYTVTGPLWQRVAWAPFAMRKLLGHGLEAIPRQAWDQGFALAGRLRGKPLVVQAGEKVHKMAQRFRRCENFDAFAQSFEQIWSPDALPMQQRGTMPNNAQSVWPLPDAMCPQDPVARMMAKDSMGYLPDDILCKVDRAAMAVSLETRVPFLDHRVVEFAWQLPQSLKIREGQGKWLLRQVLYRYVPKALIERPKAGFGIPVGQWLRGPLRDWAEDLLEPKAMQAQGYLDPDPIQAVWQTHLSGRVDHTPKLWTVLMFQAWLRAQKKRG